ncbi:MAG: hypothetical protein R3C02_03190 [Planctomycetaceae bacterium]
MALVILGGLTTSTLLNLLVLPALFLRFGPQDHETEESLAVPPEAWSEWKSYD